MTKRREQAMRAEDVKPGMWVRDRDEVFQVAGHIDDLWFRIAYLDGHLKGFTT